MSELDTYTFMEKNGNEFFDQDAEQATEAGETVIIEVSIPIMKARLAQIYAHCEEQGIAIEDFLCDIVGGWLNEA